MFIECLSDASFLKELIPPFSEIGIPLVCSVFAVLWLVSQKFGSLVCILAKTVAIWTPESRVFSSHFDENSCNFNPGIPGLPFAFWRTLCNLYTWSSAPPRLSSHCLSPHSVQCVFYECVRACCMLATNPIFKFHRSLFEMEQIFCGKFCSNCKAQLEARARQISEMLP